MLNSNQFSTNYIENQQQLALNNLSLIVQGLNDSFAAQQQLAQQAQKSAEQSYEEARFLGLAAIAAQEDQIDITRQVQDFQNQLFNRSYFSTLQNLTNYKKSVKISIEQADKVAAQRIGSSKASLAASGIVASEGAAQDFITQVTNESRKDTQNLYTQAYNNVLQSQEDLLNIRAQQTINNFNIDTQVNFNVNELERRLRYL